MSTRTIRVLTGRDVRRLLPMAECIELMERTLAQLAQGRVVMPVRLVTGTQSGAGVVALMPAHLPDEGLFGYKAVTVFPGNDPATEPTHQAAVAVLDQGSGRMMALVDGTAITEIRTAAVSAVATRHLSRHDARVAAVLGAGAQGRAHLEALAHVRDLEEIRVWSRDPERAAMVARESGAAAGAVNVVAVGSAAAALEGADVVVTATSSRTPVLRSDWLAPGAHVNAVGSCIPVARELDGPTVARCRLIVDQRDAALTEAGDILLAIEDGLIDRDHIQGDLGEVVTGTVPGRTSEDELTVFESLGLGAEDVAAGGLVLRKAEVAGIGSLVDL